MRICVLQFGPQSNPERDVPHIDVPDSGKITTPQHTLEYRWICNETAKNQVDAILQEGFDFYLNLLWGASRDPLAEFHVNQYFASLDVPSAGVRGWGHSLAEESHESIRQLGDTHVWGVQGHLPAAKLHGHHAIREKGKYSTRYYDSKLESSTGSINGRAYTRNHKRFNILEVAGTADRQDCTEVYDHISRPSHNFRTQWSGKKGEFTVTVVELDNSAIALNPRVTKSDELLSKGTQPVLFECIQQAALEAFETSPFKGGHMGCDIELQVTGDGVTATSVDCRPMSLLQPKYDCRDTKLVGAFPGGLNALINVFIANFSLHGNMRRDLSKVAACYDAVAPVYDEQGQSNSHDDDNFKHIVQKYEFDGHVVDVACGTGFFGRVLKTHSTRASFNTTSLVGFDLSPGMAKICRETGLYDQVYVAGMQSCLLQYHGRDQIDHVVCFGAVHFLTPEEFGLFLVQCFVIANRSITIAVDEIPDSHNMRLRNKGMSYMHSINHLANMKNFGEPEGWRLVSHRRRFSWNSPTTGDDVYSTFFRFERMAQKNILMTRIMEKN